MSQTQKLDALTEEAPNEIPHFMKAAKLMKDISGLSAYGDELTLEKIQRALSFKPSTPEGKELKRKILRQAKAKSLEGMDGKGLFFIS